MRAYEAALATVWAIREESLRQILEIASGEHRLTAEGLQALAAQLGRPLDNTRNVTVREGVAILPVTGPIMRYAGFFSSISGATSTGTLATDFRKALDDPSVRAIVLHIDSPGGEATGVGELSGMVFDARGSKPLAAYVEGMGASAAYWLASACEEVVVAPTAIVGSIGVVAAYRDTTERDAKNGVTNHEFISSQSPNKRPNPGTTEGGSQIQAMVDSIAAVFVADVARNRDVTMDTVVSDFGAGGVLVGVEAVAAGMADRVGTLEGLVAELQARTKPKMPMYGAAQPRGTAGGKGGVMPEEDAGGNALPVKVEDSPAFQALLKQQSELQAQLVTERTARITSEAQAFANEMCTAGAIRPYLREQAGAFLAECLKADAGMPVEGLAASFKAFVEKQKASGPDMSRQHIPTAETLKDARVLGAPTSGNTESSDPQGDRIEAAIRSRGNGHKGGN